MTLLRTANLLQVKCLEIGIFNLMDKIDRKINFNTFGAKRYFAQITFLNIKHCAMNELNNIAIK